MDWRRYVGDETEQPLDRFPVGISETAIFRTIGCVGDSLSAGEIQSLSADGKTGYHDYHEYSWGQYIGRRYGITIRTYARGGLSAHRLLEVHGDRFGAWDPENACQAYIIALGENDMFYFKQEVGTVSDIEAADRPTVAHYYGRVIQRFKEIQPRAKFFLVAPPCGNDSKDEKRREFTQLLHAMAAHFTNTYVIDLFRYAPVYDEEFRQQFYLYGHMSASGYIFTANMIDAYIDYLVRHNPEDFRRVPFIGTDLQ